MDLNDIVSTFWQDNDIESDMVDMDDPVVGGRQDDDMEKENFSGDEIDELREIFQTQVFNNNKNDNSNNDNDNNISDKYLAGNLVSDTMDDAPDELFFRTDIINTTMEQSRCSDFPTDEEIGDNSLGGSLGKPKRGNNSISIVIPTSTPNTSVIEKSIENLSFAKTSSSGTTAKSSLEVQLSDSPKADLNVTNLLPSVAEHQALTSGSSYNDDSIPDTEPISQTEYLAALAKNPDAFIPRGRLVESHADDSIGVRSGKPSNRIELSDLSKDESMNKSYLTIENTNKSDLQKEGYTIPNGLNKEDETSKRGKTKKRKTSGPLSVITVPNETEQVFVLDETNQAKAKCHELTLVGSMFFTNDKDYEKVVGKRRTTATTNDINIPSSSNGKGRETAGGKANGSYKKGRQTEKASPSTPLMATTSTLAEERTIVINCDTTTTTGSETETEERRRQRVNNTNNNDTSNNNSHSRLSSSMLVGEVNGSANLFDDSVSCFFSLCFFVLFASLSPKYIKVL